ncbi:sentrin-specific protease SENP8 (SUMO-specific protease) [Fusarium mexicanum]|uniref:Sentrin-specific protease SENP8 (SUMO-specific protease) n=1 Tax=Fusarium mexicanum TaxID=751941 RepID=A0A8H5MRS8_9HYPO|nr:sentrin-specific protease SENP8 (SUMO-specific protease) [Fusarium mexicanum]
MGSDDAGHISTPGALSPFVPPSSYQSFSDILACYSRLHGLLNFRSRRSRRPGSSSSADTSDSTLTANSDYEITPADSTSYSPEISPRSSTSSTSTSSSTSKQHKMPFRQRMARHFGDSLAPEKPYLSYYDVLLTAEDIKALKHDWLTDNNIAFWEEYLERETLPKYPQARIILLRPSMTFLLMKEPDLRSVQSALPDFSKVTHIFLPINDNRNVSVAEGGSHWSLLLVSTLDGVAFHYDSLGGANYSEANVATRKLANILGRPLRFINLDDCPQQENGSDCGVFVCLLMRHLLVKRLLCANAREKVSMSMGGKMVDSYGGRKEMMRIIENLRKEGERRRSEAQTTKARNVRQLPKSPPRSPRRVSPRSEEAKKSPVNQSGKGSIAKGSIAKGPVTKPKGTSPTRLVDQPPWRGMRNRVRTNPNPIRSSKDSPPLGPQACKSDRVTKEPRIHSSPPTPVKVRGKRSSSATAVPSQSVIEKQ